jgi:ABC-type nickel/cobalt efflux system permease component RcnA
VVVLTMSARNIAALAKVVGVLLLVGFALLILKWALITAAILIVPFGIWWVWDRIHTQRRRRADAR